MTNGIDHHQGGKQAEKPAAAPKPGPTNQSKAKSKPTNAGQQNAK